MSRPSERDIENELAALLESTTALDSRALDRTYEALNGPDAHDTVHALADEALRSCAAQGQDAPAQLRAACEGKAAPASSTMAGATLPAPHARIYRPPQPVISMIREAQVEIEAASVALHDARFEYLRYADMFEIEPEPVPHVYGPHEAMASGCRLLAWLSTAAGMLCASWLGAGAFGGPAAGALAAVALFVMMEFTVSLALGALLEPRTFSARSRTVCGFCLGLLLIAFLIIGAGRAATGEWAARFLAYSPLAGCAIEVSLVFLAAWAFLAQRRFGWSGAIVRRYCSLQERQRALLRRIEYLRQGECPPGRPGFGETCEIYAGAAGTACECIARGADEEYERKGAGSSAADRRADIDALRPSWAALHQRIAQERSAALTRFVRTMSLHIPALEDLWSAWCPRLAALLTFVTICLTIATLEWGVVSRALKLFVAAPHAPDLSVLSGGALASGLAVGVNSSGGINDWTAPDHDGTFVMHYPAGQAWGAVFITAGPPLSPARPSADLSSYQTLQIEMRGDSGEFVDIGIKDATQPDDGRELRLQLQITGSWRTYTIPLKSFPGADLKKIYVLAEFVFEGPRPRTVEVRSVKFTRATAHPP